RAELAHDALPGFRVGADVGRIEPMKGKVAGIVLRIVTIGAVPVERARRVGCSVDTVAAADTAARGKRRERERRRSGRAAHAVRLCSNWPIRAHGVARLAATPRRLENSSSLYNILPPAGVDRKSDV